MKDLWCIQVFTLGHRVKMVMVQQVELAQEQGDHLYFEEVLHLLNDPIGVSPNYSEFLRESKRRPTAPWSPGQSPDDSGFFQ